jgi:dihydroneopterin aldolase
METSAFETLEALGTNLADTILAWSNPGLGQGWQIRIRLEKPTAVPFADCPEVEIRVGPDAPRPGTV